MSQRVTSTVAFVAIGLLIYAGIYAGAEWLVYRNGQSNPFFKIARANVGSFDWVILGASHAMPLDFSDFNARMQNETGLKIINLASPGTGPLYNRFVLETFLQRHTATNILYVADSFSFYSRTWNEDRFSDSKLLRGTPLSRTTFEVLWKYCREYAIDRRVLLDALSGFSKINNRDRFQLDMWEGERQFDRVARASPRAVDARISYLFPVAARSTIPGRYTEEFGKLLELAIGHNVRVVVVKMPVPKAFRMALPDEVGFDRSMARMLGQQNVPYRDFSVVMEDARFYFDTDHLNRAGVSEFFDRYLKAVLVNP